MKHGSFSLLLTVVRCVLTAAVGSDVTFIRAAP